MYLSVTVVSFSTSTFGGLHGSLKSFRTGYTGISGSHTFSTLTVTSFTSLVFPNGVGSRESGTGFLTFVGSNFPHYSDTVTGSRVSGFVDTRSTTIRRSFTRGTF